MRNKEYIVDKLEYSKNLVNNLYNDIENNKQYITKEHLLNVLAQLSNHLEQLSNRLDLED